MSSSSSSQSSSPVKRTLSALRGTTVVPGYQTYQFQQQQQNYGTRERRGKASKRPMPGEVNSNLFQM